LTEVVTNILTQNKPRYLMVDSTPNNIFENIGLGINMYDYVMHKWIARNILLFILIGIINIKKEKCKDDFSPIEADNELIIDKIHTKAYLRHLIRSQEILGAQIASLHNLHFYLWLVRQAREKIIEGTFYDWKEKMVKVLGQRL